MDWIITLLEWAIIILAALLALPYVLGPALVWMSQKMPEAYRFKRLDGDNFLAERSETFRQLHQDIVGAGFSYIGSSELLLSHSSMAFSIYYQPETQLCCTLSSAYSEPMNTTQLEFTQLYEDGSLISINNNPLFNIYPEWDKKTGYRFPKVNDFNELLMIADTLLAMQPASIRKKALPQGAEFELIEAHLNEELQRLVSLGYVSDHVVDGERRLTAKGALLFTWKLCWPIKGWLGRRDETRSISALKAASH